MKAQVNKLYQTVQRRLIALKVKLTQFKQQVSAWLVRHQRRLWFTVIGIAVLVIVAIGAVVWQRSPAFRTSSKALGVSLAALLAALMVRLNLRPTAPPVVVTEQPSREERLEMQSDGRR
jgi:hypothetical protein